MLNINIAEDWIQTADLWYHILTALPTEPQPLPVGVDLFVPICLSVTKSLKNAKTLFAKKLVSTFTRSNLPFFQSLDQTIQRILAKFIKNHRVLLCF